MNFSNTSSFADVVAVIIGYINLIIPLLVGLAVLLIMYSAFRYVLKASETHGKNAEREAIMWGFIALFLIVSVWGILRIMCITFFGNASCDNASTGSSSSNGGAVNPNGPVIQILNNDQQQE